VQVQPADQFDVRPHPHIGLATVTYLLKAHKSTATTWALSNALSPARSIG